MSCHMFQPPALLLSSLSVPFLSQEVQTGCQVPGVLLQVPDGGVGSLPQTFWWWSCTTQEGVDHLRSRSVPLTSPHSPTRLLQDFFNQATFLPLGLIHPRCRALYLPLLNLGASLQPGEVPWRSSPACQHSCPLTLMISNFDSDQGSRHLFAELRMEFTTQTG